MRDWETDLSNWLAPFLEVLGHGARRRWAPVSLRCLFGRTERKSIQPMAADLTPDDYDQLRNVIARRSWDSAALETDQAGHGNGAAFRKGLSERGLAWVVGVQSNQPVYGLAVRETWPAALRRRPRKHAVAGGNPVAAVFINFA